VRVDRYLREGGRKRSEISGVFL